MFNKAKIFIRYCGLISLSLIYATLIYFLIALKVASHDWWVVFGSLLTFNYCCSGVLGLYIINSQRYDTVQIAWLACLFWLPIFGQLSFFAFGVSAIKRRSQQAYLADLAPYLACEHASNLSPRQLVKLLEPNTIFAYLFHHWNCQVSGNNHISFNHNVSQSLKAIKKIIDQAEKFIHIQYYYFSDDYLWKLIVHWLKPKLAAGVEVCVMVDFWGIVGETKWKTIQQMRQMGIQWRMFNPPFMKSLPVSFWHFRCHKKAIVVDNKYAIYGSSNLSSKYFFLSRNFFPVDDYTYYIEGPIVNSIHILMAFDWFHYTKHQDQVDQWLLKRDYYFPKYVSSNTVGSMVVQHAQSGPDIQTKIIVENLIQLVQSAKSSVVIATPYFMPTKALLNALVSAAASGVQVELIVPAEVYSFQKIVISMNRYYYGELLAAGVKLYEYQGFNHEKIVVVDQQIVYIGTYNWDFRSLFMNFETMMVISSATLAHELINACALRKRNALVIDQRYLKQLLDWKTRVLQVLIRLVHPLI